MKTYFLLFALACSTTTALAQDDSRTPYLTKSLASDAINRVVVNTSAGGILVSGRSGEAARVEVYIKGNNGRDLSKEEIKKRLDEDYDLSVSVSGHEVRAIAKSKHNFSDWKRQMSISFKIYVPEQTSTDLRTSGGGINLDNLKGNESFTTSGGGLNIDRLNGVVRGETSGGGISVSNSGNDINLETSGGGIIAKNCTGKIRLETSGGGLTLDNLNGNINANTSGGGIHGNSITGELNTSTSGGGIDLKQMDCSLSASTSGGSLNAQIKRVGKYLKLEASSGNINLELPLKQGLNLDLRGNRVQPTDKINSFNGEWEKDHVKGSVNGGGAPVTAEASSGNVNVRFN
ncbi:DUF4097 family beta strand repeat-containing protein [Mucilaginibacter sp. SG564]|uniref:DUF4097 family beta strand repeat-containing protein n=1 Tax=unclassified Mucilaginibacter TaxID=2617802 RepID=UPI0015530244|nr:DUF4097 family beta strand repeat-containing protein [Mucilaginibacter sp. SG564]NOW94805.1 uncharacterized protein YdeI (BOF family) [Mucilaginibacter sp. SG564]